MNPSVRVEVGNGVVHWIQKPKVFPLSHKLRYGDATSEETVVAAEILWGFDYLLSSAISTKEAIRRLRILRKARQSAFEEWKKGGDE